MREKAEPLGSCLNSDLSTKENDLAVGRSRIKGRKSGPSVGVRQEASTAS
jgi:hypothetical protein